jgi:hypothetical protein
VFGIAVHTTALFFDELYSEKNAYRTSQARAWLLNICADPVVKLPDSAQLSCAQHREWLSRSPEMNALRLALHHQVDTVAGVGAAVTSWFFTWDPFYVFQIKLLVNAVCSSMATAIPILVLAGVAYTVLLLRGPVADLRAWCSLSTAATQSTNTTECFVEKMDKHGKTTFSRELPVWYGMGPLEREELTQRILAQMQAVVDVPVAKHL